MGKKSKDSRFFLRELVPEQDKLTEDEFQEYMELTKQLMQLKLKITDENGVPHEEKLTKEEQQHYGQLASKLAPYFERINETAKP